MPFTDSLLLWALVLSAPPLGGLSKPAWAMESEESCSNGKSGKKHLKCFLSHLYGSLCRIKEPPNTPTLPTDGAAVIYYLKYLLIALQHTRPVQVKYM